MKYVIRKENPMRRGNATREIMKKRPPKRTDLRPTTVQIRVFPEDAKRINALAKVDRIRAANVVRHLLGR